MADDLDAELDRYAQILHADDDAPVDAYWDDFAQQQEQGLRTALDMYDALDEVHHDVLADVDPDAYITADNEVSGEVYFTAFRDAFEDATGMTPDRYKERKERLQDRAYDVVEHYVEQYMAARIGTDEWQDRPANDILNVVTEDMSDIEREAFFFVDGDHTPVFD